MFLGGTTHSTKSDSNNQTAADLSCRDMTDDEAEAVAQMLFGWRNREFEERVNIGDGRVEKKPTSKDADAHSYRLFWLMRRRLIGRLSH